MRVERFALFFPPLLFKVRRGETEYGIGAIPLGGYVRISGMNPHEELSPEVAPRAYFAQPVWKRIVVIAAGPLVNLVLAFVIIWAVLVLKGLPEIKPTVDVIQKGSPAAQVLQHGDRLLAVDGVRAGGDVQRFIDQVASHKCAGRPTDGCHARTPAALTIERDGRRMTVHVTPVYDAKLDPPRSRVGFAFGSGYDAVAAGPAVGRSVTSMWNVTKATVSAIGRLFYSEKARKQVSGVVGSYETTRVVINEFGYTQALQILALISLSLAIVNLFPFLPLDGGHIFWAIAEKVRGRRIPGAVMERASVVGFMLVAFLFIVGLSNDIGRLQDQGFGLR
jgi:regulator of sigma E protease